MSLKPDVRNPWLGKVGSNFSPGQTAPALDTAVTPCGLKTGVQDPSLPFEEVCISPSLKCVKCVLPCGLNQWELMFGTKGNIDSSKAREEGSRYLWARFILQAYKKMFNHDIVSVMLISSALHLLSTSAYFRSSRERTSVYLLPCKIHEWMITALFTDSRYTGISNIFVLTAGCPSSSPPFSHLSIH